MTGIISRKIHDERLRRHMTQEHLATAAGVSAKTIRRLEAGEAVSAETLRAVAAVLELDLVNERPASADVFCPEGIEPTPSQRDLIARARRLYGDDLAAIAIPDPAGLNNDKMRQAQRSYRVNMTIAALLLILMPSLFVLYTVLSQITSPKMALLVTLVLCFIQSCGSLAFAERAPRLFGSTLPRIADRLHKTIVCFVNGHMICMVAGERVVEQEIKPLGGLGFVRDEDGRTIFTEGLDVAIGPLPPCPPVEAAVRKARLKKALATQSFPIASHAA